MSRPKRKPINQLRTKVWFEHIRAESGVKNAYELGGGAAGADENNWYKYQAGARVPSQKTLAEIERDYPGSRDIFDVGPSGSRLWEALAAPHADLWQIIDITFPEYKEPRVRGLFGLMQYKTVFDNLLLPNHYRRGIDFIAHAKGMQKNAVYRAFSEDEISITPSTVTSVIAYWRLSSLVVFDMFNADYLLVGIMSAMNNDEIYGLATSKLIQNYINEYFFNRKPL